jgi:hypothetical protein
LKDESQTESKWTEKTISQFESNESQKENNNELSVFTQKQEEQQLVSHHLLMNSCGLIMVKLGKRNFQKRRPTSFFFALY